MNHTKTNIPIVLSSVLLLVGSLFKIMHWPFGQEMKYIGFACIGVLYLIRFILNDTKSIKGLIKVFLVISWASLIFITPIPLPLTMNIILIILMVLGVSWGITEIIDVSKKGINNSNLILILAGLFLVLEIIFRIYRWPGATLIYLLAIISMIVGFSIDNKRNRKLD